MKTSPRLFCSLGLILLFSQLPSAFAQQPAPPPAKTLAERLGYPANSRLLIIHADDFGMMHSVNTATIEALEKHWITSASILVPCPWFPEVAQWAKTHPDADLGVHLALNADWTSYRWPPVSPQPPGSSLLDADGYLPLLTPYVVAHAKMPDVIVETHAQVDKAIAASIHLSHLDTHMGTIVSTDDLTAVYFATGRPTNSPCSSPAKRTAATLISPSFTWAPMPLSWMECWRSCPGCPNRNGSTPTRKCSSLFLPAPIS